MMAERTELFGRRVTWFYGEQGAHFRCPGFLYTRHSGPTGWSVGRAWRFFGLICIRHNETNGGTLRHCQPAGWTVKLATVRWREIKQAFRKADNYVS